MNEQFFDNVKDVLFDDNTQTPFLSPESIDAPVGSMADSYWKFSGLYEGTGHIVRDILYRPTLVPSGDKWQRNARFIPGSTFGGEIGPAKQRDVMIVGTLPLQEQDAMGILPAIRCLLGDTRDVVQNALLEAGLTQAQIDDFYVTNLVRFPRLDNGIKKTIYAAWKNECAHYLEQELFLVKPKVILAMGTHPSQYFTKYPVTKAVGRVFDYPVGKFHTAKVICAIDPKGVIADFEKRPLFMLSSQLLSDTVNQKKQQTKDEFNIFEVDTEQELSTIVDVLIEKGHTEFSVDCEWGGGQHFLDQGAALRTVQIGWSGSESMVVILHRQHMRKAFTPYVTSALVHLRRLLQRPGIKVIGHNLAADIPWLDEYGLDLSGQLHFDTMLASQLFEPTASHVLESLSVSHIPGWIRHDFDLVDWVKDNPLTDGLSYSEIPDEILHPYGGKDACATYLLYKYYDAQFKLQKNWALGKLFRKLVMPADLSFIEIEQNGVYMDRDRLIDMEKRYRAKYLELRAKFRIMIGKPHFNPDSPIQKQTLLFDELGLTPIKTTGKYPKDWVDVCARGEQGLYSPSTDDESLGILKVHSPVAAELQKVCLIWTVLKNFLKPEIVDPITGNKKYVGGLIGNIKPDGRLHTRISQMVKTGRLASHDPNIMNMPNRQEAAIQAAAGGGLPGIRSGFAAVVGWLIVAADYCQAEICSLAYLSGDPTLIAAVGSGADVHSTVCRQMFELDCSLDEVKTRYKHLRVAAKSIVFG